MKPKKTAFIGGGKKTYYARNREAILKKGRTKAGKKIQSKNYALWYSRHKVEFNKKRRLLYLANSQKYYKK